uniref:ketopantoate reductase family protein n=1 Tax=Marinilabilia sp. TaxID=2021252 RepID=UPI0025C50AA5
MKILIVGTGGVGGYFGGRLAHAGHDVTFIARGAHKEAIEKDGLEVKSINGDFLVTNVNVTDQIANAEQPELVIISVKA